MYTEGDDLRPSKTYPASLTFPIVPYGHILTGIAIEKPDNSAVIEVDEFKCNTQLTSTCVP